MSRMQKSGLYMIIIHIKHFRKILVNRSLILLNSVEKTREREMFEKENVRAFLSTL